MCVSSSGRRGCGLHRAVEGNGRGIWSDRSQEALCKQLSEGGREGEREGERIKRDYLVCHAPTRIGGLDDF